MPVSFSPGTFLLFCMGIWGLAVPAAQAQKLKHNVWQINLSDKAQTPYSLLRPEEFLSARSIERRLRYGIELDESDLPIDPRYIEQIEALGGRIHGRCKWFNALAVNVVDSILLQKIQALPFVVSSRPLGRWREPMPSELDTKREYNNHYKKTPFYHGEAAPQARMCNMHVLHNWGYRGQGVYVAVFDGGFSNVHRAPAFDSLHQRGQLLGVYDMVDRDQMVYESSTHGTNVLSTMTANLPYLFVGTAPDAYYYLFKTEDVMSETWIEEFNWVAAAEIADSLGVEVINSSLGYTTFNDSMMNYTHERLDGTSLIARGADMSMYKGMLVVNSAGNEGRGKWRYIGTPADAFTIVTAGAVDVTGKKAAFSSWGPTGDGRIKPNLCAVGAGTVTLHMSKYEVSRSDGTSFSSPVLAGMLTSFRQIFPERSNFEIKDLAEQSASQYDNPDNGLGYGIPDFYYAYIKAHPSLVLIDMKGNSYHKKTLIDKDFAALIEVENEASISLRLLNALQETVYEKSDITAKQEVCRLTIPGMERLPGGVYLLHIKVNGQSYWFELLRQTNY